MFVFLLFDSHQIIFNWFPLFPNCTCVSTGLGVFFFSSRRAPVCEKEHDQGSGAIREKCQTPGQARVYKCGYFLYGIVLP